MTIHEAMTSSPRQIILPVLIVLFLMQMIVLLDAFPDQRRKGVRLLYILHFVISFAVLYDLLYVICAVLYHVDLTEMQQVLLRAGASLPVMLVIVYEIITAAILAAVFWKHIHYRRMYLTVDAIKETMDLLPAGIAFGKPDGTVVFRNLAVNELARRVTGKALDTIFAFQLPDSEESDGSPDRSTRVTLPDGSGSWRIHAEELTLDGDPYIQLTASDITRQSEIIKELEGKNKKLRDIQMRLDLYNRQAEQIIIAQELLTARMAVHNELGNMLLECRHYLNDPASIDEEMLLQALKNTNKYLLNEFEGDDTERDPLAEALEMADAIGVEVSISGRIPAEGTGRRILSSAIIECATNTVKHAEGNLLLVDVRRNENLQSFVLQNNGNPPAGTIRESGGLGSLRKLVEKENGSMTIDSLPGFQLTISLPGEGM